MLVGLERLWPTGQSTSLLLRDASLSLPESISGKLSDDKIQMLFHKNIHPTVVCVAVQKDLSSFIYELYSVQVQIGGVSQYRLV